MPIILTLLATASISPMGDRQMRAASAYYATSGLLTVNIIGIGLLVPAIILTVWMLGKRHTMRAYLVTAVSALIAFICNAPFGCFLLSTIYNP